MNWYRLTIEHDQGRPGTGHQSLLLMRGHTAADVVFCWEHSTPGWRGTLRRLECIAPPCSDIGCGALASCLARDPDVAVFGIGVEPALVAALRHSPTCPAYVPPRSDGAP